MIDLRSLRTAAGLHQTDVAAKMQVSQGRISQIEKMQAPSIGVVTEYLAALGGRLTLTVTGIGDSPITLPVPA